MQHFTIQALLVAFLGFIISWLFQLSSAYNKVIHKEDDYFKWGFYFRKNIVDIVLAFLCTVLLLFLIPNAMDYFNAGKNWSTPLAIICGVFNVQLVKVGKKLFEKKLTEKTGESIEENKPE